MRADSSSNAPNAAPSVVLAIDPGKDKCGVALVKAEGFDSDRVLDSLLESVLERRIVPRAIAVDDICETLTRFPDAQTVIGHATTSRALLDELQRALPHLTIHTVDETGSTLEARGLYWRANPPRGWRKLWPLSSQVPPESVDDFAAVVLAARFLSSTRSLNQHCA